MNEKTIKFIEKARLVHGDKYDYSNSKYVKLHDKILIICPIHGEFLQRGSSHINSKCGCIQCGPQKQKQTMLNRYGVEHNSYNPTSISLRKQTVNANKQSNPNRENDIQEKRRNTNLLKHGEEYYTNQEQTKQTCTKKYGVDNPFKSATIQSKIRQTNLEKYGHENIAQGILKKKIQNTMLTKYSVAHYNQRHMVNILHLITDIDWLYDQYITQRKTVIQIADELGIGDTCLGRYLKRLEIDIRKTNHSYISILWLDSIKEQENIYIQHNGNIGEYKIPGTKYKADGYCKETNTIYEFHGDFWHGNPKIYAPNIMNTLVNKTMCELYANTIERENQIISLGYNLVVIWESDWKNRVGIDSECKNN